MGRCHHVRNAIVGGHAAHGNGNIPGLGPIVYFGEDVGMDVDHDCWNTNRNAWLRDSLI